MPLHSLATSMSIPGSDKINSRFTTGIFAVFHQQKGHVGRAFLQQPDGSLKDNVRNRNDEKQEDQRESRGARGLGTQTEYEGQDEPARKKSDLQRKRVIRAQG